MSNLKIDLSFLGELEESPLFETIVPALREDPEDVDIWENLLDMAEALDDEELQLRCYRNIIVLTPKDYTAWFNAGIIHRDKGENDIAEMYFQKTAELKPGFSDAWADLARIYFKRELLEEGIKYTEKAIAAKASNTLPYINAGYHLVMLGEPEKSIAYSISGIDQGEEYACTFNQAHAYLALGDKQKAMELYAQSLQAADSRKEFVSDFKADFVIFKRYGLDKKEYLAMLEEL